MTMAYLPVPVRDTDPLTTREQKIIDLLFKGWTPAQIARRLSGGDLKRRKSVAAQCYLAIARCEEFQLYQGAVAKGIMIWNLPEVAEALCRRGRKGNVMAAKLLYEATGFYSPKMQHDHTGEIRITVATMPRPEEVEDITDATVVEEHVA